MEKQQLRYSGQNISISSKRSYKLQLMEKIELGIKRIRWKAFFYEQGSSKYIPKNYGLDSLNFSPNIKKMINLEKDSTNLQKTIKFRVTKSSFQLQLEEYIRCRKNIKTILRFAEKGSNVYKIPKKHYEKLVNNVIILQKF